VAPFFTDFDGATLTLRVSFDPNKSNELKKKKVGTKDLIIKLTPSD